MILKAYRISCITFPADIYTERGDTSIKDKIALIESDLKRKDALTASQIQKQNCDILSLALDCIRFCGATEREELSQMKQPLSQNM